MNFLFITSAGKKGKGLFTKKSFKKGERVLLVKGTVREFQAKNAAETHRYPNWIGIGKYLWLAPRKPFSYLNHSCDPNLGMMSEKEFVAVKNIKSGEELSFDYSISDDEEEWSMKCFCGSPRCRGIIRAIQFLPYKIYRQRLPFVLPYFQKVYDQYHSTEVKTELKPAL